MQVMKLKAPGGLDKLELTNIEPRPPGQGEVQVAIKASSLNFHDYLVVSGLLPTEDGRIPMSDGAGIVTAVANGTAAVTATSGAASDNASVTVLAPTPKITFQSNRNNNIDVYVMDVDGLNVVRLIFFD